MSFFFWSKRFCSSLYGDWLFHFTELKIALTVLTNRNACCVFNRTRVVIYQTAIVRVNNPLRLASIITGIDWFFFDVQSSLHFIEPEQPIDEYTVIIEIDE